MADEQQLPGLRIPLLRWTPIQFCLALCSGFYIAFPLLGPYRLLVFMLEEYGIVPMMVLCPVAYVLYGIQLCLGIALTKWVLLQRIKPSMTRLGSFYHLRWWFVDRFVFPFLFFFFFSFLFFSFLSFCFLFLFFFLFVLFCFVFFFLFVLFSFVCFVCFVFFCFLLFSFYFLFFPFLFFSFLSFPSLLFSSPPPYPL